MNVFPHAIKRMTGWQAQIATRRDTDLSIQGSVDVVWEGDIEDWHNADQAREEAECRISEIFAELFGA